MKLLAFFNNKGGVGKTTLAYHVAWMLSDLGNKVLILDMDPQANLTSMFLPEERLEEIWNPGEESGESVMGALDPLVRGVGDVKDAHLEQVNARLWLVPGDLRLSNFEGELSDAWGGCIDGKEPAFRKISAFHRIAETAGESVGADYIIMDVGPNFGALNRAALTTATHVLVPLAPDLFSLQGLKNLGPTLRRWRREWADRKPRNPAKDLSLPAGEIEPIGYVILQFGVRDSKPVKSYQRWADQIPETYWQSVMDDPERAISISKDSACLGMVKHYRSLVPLAMEAHKPIFHLKAVDGAIGAHYENVQHCRIAFEALTNQIVRRMNSTPAGMALG